MIVFKFKDGREGEEKEETVEENKEIFKIPYHHNYYIGS